jgi:putative transposase
MFSSFRYRIYPDKANEERLLSTLAMCCYLYNKSMEERELNHRENWIGLSYEAQAEVLPSFKEENPAFKDVHSQVLQNVLKRVDRSYINFFQHRARRPKLKKESRYRSFTYPQATADMIGKNSITLQKIGRIRMVKHRPVKGLVKTVTVLKTNAQEWYAIVTTVMHGTAAMLEPRQPVG